MSKVIKLIARISILVLSYFLVPPALISIMLYKNTVSGKTTTRCCRYTPSCSTYTYDAIRLYGLFKGMKLGRERLSRCNPHYEGGFDPVP